MSPSADPATAVPPSLGLAAPAKLNLGLRILGRRADGYHRLASVFVPLELADHVAVDLRAGPGLELCLEGDAAGVPDDGRNLVQRAARAFLAAAGLDQGLSIQLDKRIPAAAGLGGGSSDAAATLRALDRMFPGALSGRALARLALDLGADVPFFLDPRPALVTGIGELLEPLAAPRRLDLLLLHPGLPLETRAVYEAYDAARPREASLTLEGAESSLRRLFACLGEAGAEAPLPEALLVNDLEAAATGLCPALGSLREVLRAAGALGVGMSGSGPTMYGVFESEAGARQARQELPTAVGRSWVTATRAAA